MKKFISFRFYLLALIITNSFLYTIKVNGKCIYPVNHKKKLIFSEIGFSICCCIGSADTVRLLLESGAKPDAVNNINRTAGQLGAFVGMRGVPTPIIVTRTVTSKNVENETENIPYFFHSVFELTNQTQCNLNYDVMVVICGYYFPLPL